jgi:rhomboid protease GluP
MSIPQFCAVFSKRANQFRYYRNTLSGSQGGDLPLSYQWQQRIDRWKNAVSSLFGGSGENNQPRPKLCPACGSLVGISAIRCHQCGANLRFSLAAANKGLSGIFGEEAPVTRGLLIANIAMFGVGYMASLAMGQSGFSFTFSGNGEALYKLGASWMPAILYLHEWYRLVTASFLHFGLLHLGMNMMVLLDIGPQVEQEFGSSRYLFFYTITGISGFGLSAVRGHFAAGASCALMGMIGLLLAMNSKRAGALAQAQKSRLISWITMTFMIGFFPGVRIDNWGHFGGLAAGYLLGRIVSDREPVTPREKQVAMALGWLAGAIIVASFVFMFIHYRDPIPGAG